MKMEKRGNIPQKKGRREGGRSFLRRLNKGGLGGGARDRGRTNLWQGGRGGKKGLGGRPLFQGEKKELDGWR